MKLIYGDCLKVLNGLEDNSIDSAITDPPYHLTSCKKSSKGFRNQEWDGGDIAFRKETWDKVLRVLKPGSHLCAFGGTRTYHKLVCAIEDAGFEIRDCISWLYGSGMPKSYNIGKRIKEYEGWGTALKRRRVPDRLQYLALVLITALLSDRFPGDPAGGLFPVVLLDPPEFFHPLRDLTRREHHGRAGMYRRIHKNGIAPIVHDLFEQS